MKTSTQSVDTAVLVYVVLYLRMSSDEQAVSIRQQREECLSYCRKMGYKVLREYVDEGLSGSKEPEKRLAFQQMIRDSNRKDFSVVICWATSRFGRLDSLDGGLPKAILRQNGVRLETAKGEVQDWNTFEGRLVGAILSELDNLYSRNLGADSLRGKLDAINNHSYPHGSTPYGFDRLYTDGTDVVRVLRTQKHRKPKNWRTLLTPNENEKLTVAWLFEQYASRDVSFRQLAIELDAKGVASPDNLAKASNGKWSYLTVGKILQDKIYIGTAHIGTGRKVGVAFKRAEPTEVPNFCDAIVDYKVYNEVQEKIAKNRAGRHKVQTAKASPLSGVVVCGHCGYRMQKYGKKGHDYFVCSSQGKRPHLGCHQWRVSEKALLIYVCQELVRTVDRALLETLQRQENQSPPSNMETMEQQASALRAKVKTAVMRWMECDEDVKDMAKEHLTKLKGELSELEERLSLMKSAKAELSTSEAREWWKAHRENLIEVCGAHWADGKPKGVSLDNGSVIVGVEKLGGGQVDVLVVEPTMPSVWADADTFRAFLKKMGVEVKVWWEQVCDTPRRKRGTSMFSVSETEFTTALDWNSSDDGNISDNQRIPVVRATVKVRHLSPQV